MPSLLVSLLFFICSTAPFIGSIFCDTERLVPHSWTLNVSDPSLPVYFGSSEAGNLSFYPLFSFWDNVSVSSDPYSYLCFISSDQFAFILSICMDSVVHTPIVWCANRQKPARGKFNITLTLQMDGDLVLQGDADTSPAWRTDTAHKGVVKMRLEQDPINLVLYDSEGGVVWQSMDHPTDTLTHWQALRVGMKLVSWASPTDPSPGSYSLLVRRAFVVLIYTAEGGIRYCYLVLTSESGIDPSQACHDIDTTEHDSFAVVTVSANGFISTPNFTNLTKYDYEYDTSLMPCGPASEQSNKTFLRLEYDGSLHLYVLDTYQWLDVCSYYPTPNRSDCGFPLQCGPYGVCSSGGNCGTCLDNHFFAPLNPSNVAEGCRPTQPLLGCNHSTLNSSFLSSIQMLDMPGYDYFANDYSPPTPGISSGSVCKDRCFRNCSCSAAFWHALRSRCFHVNGPIGSLRGSQNESLYRAYLKVSVSPPSSNHSQASSQASHNNFKLRIIIGSTILVAFLTTSATFIYCKVRRSRSKNLDEEEDVMLDTVLGLPTRYTYSELQDMTHNFSKLLGKGGFGAVYEGMAGDGTKVAVKKLESARQGDKEFRSEVAIMAGIHHYNLLRLLGFCAQGARRLLVYEYMENGSLDQWLFNHSRSGQDFNSCTQRKPLAWNVRFRIAVGTAKGLAYLHESCQERIIHLDVKPQNILLDKDFVPKVADFGLSRLVGREESNVILTTMRGTPGYLAPEWLRQSTIDEKCDVFSFGMLLLEIISGRRNHDPTQDNPDCIYYPQWAFKQAQGVEYNQLPTHDGSSPEIVAKIFTDVELHDEEEQIQVMRMIKTAFLCLLEDSTLRPSMQQVVQMLEGLLDVMQVQLSSLLQGLLFVLRNATAHDHMQETVKGILAPSNVKQTSSSASTMSPLEISTR